MRTNAKEVNKREPTWNELTRKKWTNAKEINKRAINEPTRNRWTDVKEINKCERNEPTRKKYSVFHLVDGYAICNMYYNCKYSSYDVWRTSNRMFLIESANFSHLTDFDSPNSLQRDFWYTHIFLVSFCVALMWSQKKIHQAKHNVLLPVHVTSKKSCITFSDFYLDNPEDICKIGWCCVSLSRF